VADLAATFPELPPEVAWPEDTPELFTVAHYDYADRDGYAEHVAEPVQAFAWPTHASRTWSNCAD
jgi:hypothetical protein